MNSSNDKNRDTVEFIDDLSQSSGSSSLGVNEKFRGKRIRDNKNGIIKFPLLNSLDHVNEIVAFNLGKVLGVNTVETSLESYHGRECIISLLEYDLQNEYILSALDLIKLGYSIKEISQIDLLQFEQMLLFDFITRQRDRHFRNFSFLVDDDLKPVNMYKLYDNGRCLAFDHDYSFIEMDMAGTFIQQEHGFGYAYIMDMLHDTPDRLINLNVTEKEILQCFDGLYDNEESNIQTSFILKTIDFLKWI